MARAKWSKADDARLLALAGKNDHEIDLIAPAFPKRTPGAVRLRLNGLMRTMKRAPPYRQQKPAAANGRINRAVNRQAPPAPVAVDPRDLTARLLGDPLPGRSALDAKRCSAASSTANGVRQ